MARSVRHVVGVDDARFDPRRRGDVRLIGAVFSGDRLDGVLSSTVRRDGTNATRRIARMIGGSRFAPQLKAVMLQGIAFAGFNVVDVWALHRQLGIPVLIVARKAPDLAAIRRALLTHVPSGRRKWALIERAGPMEPAGNVWVQRAGLSLDETAALLAEHVRHGWLPEPLRTAHLIASALGGADTDHHETRQRA
jgi:uncharacterized protein